MDVTAAIFSLGAALLFYAYAGYPLFMRWLARLVLRRPVPEPGPVGRTWLLVPAYNEEAVISAKLENAVAVSPPETTVLVVTDGATDGTEAIVAGFERRDPRVHLVRMDDRRGKNYALNHALRLVGLSPDDVVVFTDANALFGPGAIERLRERLVQGAGCAVGRLELVDAVTGTARAEGLYWRYENALKGAEGALGRLPFANGAIFAARARHVPDLPLDVGNDFWIPVLALGRRKPVVFEPLAVAREPAPVRGEEEFWRKVRMANRQMRGIFRAWTSIDWTTRFQLLSHKVLRWLGLPLAALVVGTGVVLWPRHLMYRLVVIGIAASLALAVAGAAGRAVRVRVPLADLAVHLYVVHVAALVGVIEAVLGRRRATWEQARSARRYAG